MRVIICGGRDFNDRKKVVKALTGLHKDTVLVHGNCKGVDRLAADIWSHWEGRVEPHLADWKKHGNAAGPIRNQEMVDAGAKFVIAFPGGKGTADCVERAEKAGIQIRRVK